MKWPYSIPVLTLTFDLHMLPVDNVLRLYMTLYILDIILCTISNIYNTYFQCLKKSLKVYTTPVLTLTFDLPMLPVDNIVRFCMTLH